ncbi:unnamed protein product [Nippostrongylus brasiliensis]|uniref:DNA polymerase epsilon subunit 4 (inferred by orthology to a human protein) n=1 Tax=Nippostrongylus brasiliensis TaxID=27835 RepID=A0A0N4XCU6_NIPBR|nr:unnamed protein product [Nippostrongylus brasiliensis]
MSVDNEAVTDDAVQTSEILNCALPTSRVKKVCRLDPDLAMITSDAVQFLTKATELFVAELAKASYTQAVLEKRKTIQVKDIDRAISSKALFEFLEDTLCDWPEAESSKIVSQVGSATLENDTEMELIPEENGEEVEEEEV